MFFDWDHFYYILNENRLNNKIKDIGTFFDKKADYFNKLEYSNSLKNNTEYIINNIDYDKSDVILDLGAGTGRLSTKFAKLVKKVYALDISAKMLEYLKKSCSENNIDNIEILNERWLDLDVDKLDNITKIFSVYSIGLISTDKYNYPRLTESLKKINNTTQKEAYIVYPSNVVAFPSKLKEILFGKDIHFYGYILIMNILFSLGIYANLTFIKGSADKYHFKTIDNAYEYFVNRYNLYSENREKQLYDYLKNNLKFNGKYYYLFEEIYDALIYWNKQKSLWR